MSERRVAMTPAALQLLLDVIESLEPTVSAATLADHFGAESDALIGAGLLKPKGHDEAAVSLFDHDDAPVSLIWSPEDRGYGYFSPAAGWVTVPKDRLVRLRVEFSVFFARLMLRAEISARSAAIPLLHDLLWEIGDVRLGRRARKVPVWFARRLHDLDVWRQVKNVTQARPASQLRVLLTSTRARRMHEEAMSGHHIVDLRDVIDWTEVPAIHPDILLSRLDGSRLPDVDRALSLSPDGKRLVINGVVTIHFRSENHIKVIRALVAGYHNGKRCRAEDLLTSVGSSVGTLRRFFGSKKWAELSPYLKSHNGLWGFEL